MDLGLKGKKVIIGGATRGISKALTELFAAEGADIGMFSRNADALGPQQKALAAKGVKVIAKPFTLDNRET
ncbi:MAG: hypothetical protein ABWZ40_03430, partial [Caulobacterales bacterium]